MLNIIPLAARGGVLIVLLTGGCTTERKAPPVQDHAVESVSTPAEREGERMVMCQQELEALKNINTEQYSQYQAAFSRLMSGAANYANVRSKVSLNVQDTVDARYRYQVSLLCSDVSQAVMNGLTEREGKLK
ncbi:hypothetical protein ACIP8G_00110 [Serratia liquefaciens]|uniref:hypothetical protein n=1 Tax=Serratia liquefaciens TaxID=614 RepID=UPI00380D027F